MFGSKKNKEIGEVKGELYTLRKEIKKRVKSNKEDITSITDEIEKLRGLIQKIHFDNVIPCRYREEHEQYLREMVQLYGVPESMRPKKLAWQCLLKEDICDKTENLTIEDCEECSYREE